MKQDRDLPCPTQMTFLESYVESFLEEYLMTLLVRALNGRFDDDLEEYKSTVIEKCRAAFQEGWLLHDQKETMQKWALALLVPIVADEKGVDPKIVQEWFEAGNLESS